MCVCVPVRGGGTVCVCVCVVFSVCLSVLDLSVCVCVCVMCWTSVCDSVCQCGGEGQCVCLSVCWTSVSVCRTGVHVCVWTECGAWDSVCPHCPTTAWAIDHQFNASLGDFSPTDMINSVKMFCFVWKLHAFLIGDQLGVLRGCLGVETCFRSEIYYVLLSSKETPMAYHCGFNHKNGNIFRFPSWFFCCCENEMDAIWLIWTYYFFLLQKAHIVLIKLSMKTIGY